MNSENLKVMLVCAGGKGTRMWPFTDPRIMGFQKHFLSDFHLPMIAHVLNFLCELKIEQVVMVCGGPGGSTEAYRAIVEALFSGFLGNFKLVRYVAQDREGGIADAFKPAEFLLREMLAEVGQKKFGCILGDNLFLHYGKKVYRGFQKFLRDDKLKAYNFFVRVPDPHRYGVPEFDQKGNLIRIWEKPEKPPSDMSVIGLYGYEVGSFFKAIAGQKESARNELEITGANNFFIKKKTMGWQIIGDQRIPFGGRCVWTDTGNYLSNLYGALAVARDLEFVEGVEKLTFDWAKFEKWAKDERKRFKKLMGW